MIFKNTNIRRGFTLIEVLVFGSVGLALMVLGTGLFLRIFRHDAWNAGRMDAVATLAVAHVQLAEDRWLGREAQLEAGGDAIRLKLFGSRTRSDEAVYRWGGPGAALRRAGRALGLVAPSSFAGVERNGVLGAVEIAVRPVAGEGKAPHRIRMTVPLRMPDAGSHHAFAYFTGAGPGDGGAIEFARDPALP